MVGLGKLVCITALLHINPNLANIFSVSGVLVAPSDARFCLSWCCSRQARAGAGRVCGQPGHELRADAVEVSRAAAVFGAQEPVQGGSHRGVCGDHSGSITGASVEYDTTVVPRQKIRTQVVPFSFIFGVSVLAA